MEENSLYIESHYDVLDSAILLSARNKASEANVAILTTILDSLDIKDYEIRLIPPENGCYQDTIKVVWKISKNALECIALVAAIVAAFPVIFPDNMQKTKDALTIIKEMKEMGIDCNVTNLPTYIKNVCNKDNFIRKQVSKKYSALKEDNNIKSDKTVVHDSKGQNKKEHTIYRADFDKYIINNLEEEFEETIPEALIELVSAILKNTSKARQWIGVYHGNDIKSKGIVILADEEIISFYLKDDEFKDGIKRQIHTFKEGDFIKSELVVTGKIRGDDNLIKSRRISATNVIKFNEKEQKSVQNNLIEKSISQLPLFSSTKK